MVVYSHAMGEGSAVCYVVIVGVLGRSVEANLSFMTLVSIVVSDRLVLAMSRRHS